MRQPGVDQSAMMIYQYYFTTSLHGMQNFEGSAQQINSHTSIVLVDVSYPMMMIYNIIY
jgi:hypothetical protein